MNPTTWLIAFADRFVIELLVLSWQALVLVSFAWFSLKVVKIWAPVVRHQTWLFCLIAIALLPVLTPLVQTLSLARPTNRTLNYVIDAPRAAIELAPTVTTQVKNKQETLANKPPFVPASVLPALPLLFFVWLLGAASASLRLAKNQISLGRIKTRAQRITLAELNLEGESCQIDLRLSKEVDCPLLHGLVRPAILLPSDITEWTTVDERRAMIQHELAHIERLDTVVNYFQTALQIVLFFHPLVRYACRQLSLERELACDERVVARGAVPENYADGLLKVAERRLLLQADHQLAFFTSKRSLERRIEMVLNFDRVRAGARHWKWLSVFAGLIAVVTWLLIPIGGLKSGQAQFTDRPIDKLLTDRPTDNEKLRLVRTLGNNKAFAELIDMALKNSDAELRRLAAVRLTELEGDGSTSAMVELYQQTNDPEVKIMLIEKFAGNSEMEPLIQIASADANAEYRLRALRRIKSLQADSDSNDIKNWDLSLLADQLRQVTAEPPPPPPPPSPLDMVVEDKSLSSHKSGESVFTLLREMAYASMRHDASFFERVLDDDYQGVMADGTTRNKAEEIAEATRKDRQITKVEFDEFDVSEDNGRFIATVGGTIHALINGSEHESEVHYKIHGMKVNGQIKITSIDRM